MSRSIVMFGDSVFLEGLAVGLKCCPELHVVIHDANVNESEQKIEHLDPVAIIFELAVNHPHNAIALMNVRPSLLLVGVDLNSRRTLVLSAKETDVLTTNDLTKLINPHDKNEN